MVRVAQDRITDLFGLADAESRRGNFDLADRYVGLARKIGTRYNVRLLSEYRERYCRGCSAYWIEGRSVRTRLRRAHRVRTCLRCGRERRVRLRPPPVRDAAVETETPRRVARSELAEAEPPLPPEEDPDSDEGEEE
jgi:ribonuclease P protein subunit RPR2